MSSHHRGRAAGGVALAAYVLGSTLAGGSAVASTGMPTRSVSLVSAALAAKKKPAKGTLRVVVSGSGSYSVTGEGLQRSGSASKSFRVRPGAYTVRAPVGAVNPRRVTVRRGKTAMVTVTFSPPAQPPGQTPAAEPPAPPAPSPTPLTFGNTLTSGRTLPAGYALTSPSGRFRAAMQGNGNFVVYDGDSAKWSTVTAGTGANRLVMQGDGNLVLYAGNTPKWTSNTAGTGSTRLVLQDDGNLVLYENDRATWSWRDGYLGGDLRAVNTLRPGVTLWAPGHRYGAVMQGDGNFVVYDGDSAKWSTATTGTGANRLVMQGDGNLVLYAGNTPKWTSNTAGTGSTRLVLQDDGNLVLYENDRATWSWRDGYLGGDLRAVNTLRPGVTLWAPGHRYGAVMQGDGNFVVYDGDSAKWSTATTGTGANRLVMQGDGNLVLYAGNTPKWATNTAGTGSTRLVMQDDGNLVLYSGSGPTWSSNATLGGPYNAGIVAAASRFADGAYGGQCLVFVEDRVSDAGGPTIRMGNDTTTYQSQWPRWADEVQWSQAAPGDIVQFQAGASVHTLILTGGNSPSTAQVVDSNFGNNERVHRGSFQSRASSFPNNSYRIWRVRK